MLTTVVENGLRSGWLSLGHQDGVGEVIPMLEASRGDGTSGSGSAGRMSIEKRIPDTSARPDINVT